MEATASADPFLAKLAAGVATLSRSRRCLVAVSGGRDSVALLHGLHAIGFRRLTVIHLDHGLRGAASRADARFVGRLAARLGHPFLGTDCDTRTYAELSGLSLEHAGRLMRHEFFEGAVRRARSRVILLAHHADDQVETCLFNFLRGAGAAGLAGMHAVKEHSRFTLHRPLLAVRRAEIDAFVIRKKIRFREDATNADPAAATRNRLRHEVIPALAGTMGDSFADAILRAATISAAEDEWMRSEVTRVGVGPELTVKVLRAEPLALRRRVMRAWLEAGGIAEAGFAEVERVLSLLDVDAGPAKVNLPGGRHARRRQGRIFLE